MTENNRMMNVLSLFDGMSCGQIALQRAGIDINRYYAAEIDQYAIKVTQHNFPNTIQLGNIKQVVGLTDIDLLIGGSPCQGFSFAGKQLNFKDERSRLFFEYVRLLNEVKPKYFLLENVKMKKEYENIISEYLGVKPIKINSSLVSAQNRERFYWTNIPAFGVLEDKGIIARHYCGDYLDRSRSPKMPIVWQRRNGILDCLGYYGNNSNSQRIYGIEGKMPTLLTNNTGGNNPLWVSLDGKTAYRANINFCEWLQTVPENYTNTAPINQRYRLLGNGWTVDVISHFFKQLKKVNDHPNAFEKGEGSVGEKNKIQSDAA